MRLFLTALIGITLFLATGCRSSSLTIEIVGPDEVPLSGVGVEGNYQTRKSPADRMPRTDHFDLVTDKKGRISLTTNNYIDGVHLSIHHPTYTDLQAKIQGFPGSPSKGFELQDIGHPYSVSDTTNLEKTVIRFRLDVR
ncbi:MAG: hypothetical protein ACYS8W_12125 [Planctomycetota bacterium]|jgi:hypothetical protein